MEQGNIYKLGRQIIDVFYNKGYKDVSIQFQVDSEKKSDSNKILMHAKIFATKDGSQEFLTVVKSAPINLSFRKCMPVKSLYLREILFYTKIAPIYDNLQDQFELCVPQEMRCVLPKCLATSEEYQREMLVLEDLNYKGFLVSPEKNIDYEHAAIILRVTAKFHALSFIYEERYPKRFREMTEECVFDFFETNREYDHKYMLMHGEKAMEQFLNAITDFELRKRCLNAMGTNAIVKFKEIAKSGKIKAIIHGENWHCNYLFKYKDNKPIEAIPVDFQWVRYGSIAYDFIFLFTSIDKEIRRLYFSKLMEEYYSSFKGFLLLCGYNSNKFFTYEDFKNELKSQALICLVAYILVYPCIENRNVNLLDMLASPTAYETNTEEYSSFVNDIVIDWAKLGFI